MARIKIISNPYKKEIRYQKWSDTYSVWADIDFSNCKNSKLLSEELTKGFFPFCAKKIVDAIIDEYAAGDEKTEICFEGTDDEFRELESVCADPAFKNVVIPSRSETTLENARDILPEVRTLFQELSPLINQSVSLNKIQRDLGRFTDASSDVVPVCVLGNYSAGKSTFINALIGSEILPSGTEPITAKIYKIARSKFEDRARVCCQYQDKNIIIQYKDNETLIECEQANPLSEALKEGLSGMKDESIMLRVNKTMSILNDFEKDVEDTLVSDLIEVEIPFAKGVLAKSQHPFVLFDTPGSNSASNARHLQVLKQAMANMTNGLPIFLSTPDALDSTDNENLYNIIHDLDELDSRFTMIVVNKADGPGLQRKDSTDNEQNRILNQAVPRNLYSGGLFYVSSILGLGAKSNGEFLDDFYAETYDDQVYKYSNPQERRYKTLYVYNIMPSQIKSRSDALAAGEKDLVYANSGLFSIETEVENFAGKYSAYNKCFQSQMFLRRVIQITENEIEAKKVRKDAIRQKIKDQLEVDKQQLINRLEGTSTDEQGKFVESYHGYMQEYITEADDTFSAENLNRMVEEITDVQETEMDFSGRKDDVKKSWAAVSENFKAKLNDAPKKFSFATVKELSETLKNDFGTVQDSIKAQRDTRHQVDKEVSRLLLEHVSDEYEKRLAEAHNLIDEKSQAYWTEKTEQLREILVQIVSGSDVLTEERRSELQRIIITYKQITFKESPANSIFNVELFERHLKLGDFVIWSSDHLDISKLSKAYSDNFNNGVDTRYQSIRDSHRESAAEWIRSLLDEIFANIIEYSPELSRQAQMIADMTEEIEDLEYRQIKLKEYTEKLCAMMDWKRS